QTPPCWHGFDMHDSHASPSASPSAFAWSLLGTLGQLSHESLMPSRSVSVPGLGQVPTLSRPVPVMRLLVWAANGLPAAPHVPVAAKVNPPSNDSRPMSLTVLLVLKLRVTEGVPIFRSRSADELIAVVESS